MYFIGESMKSQDQFIWERQQRAEKLLLDWLQRALELNTFLAKFSKHLTNKTSTKLFQWIDFFTVAASEENEQLLNDHGFNIDGNAPSGLVYSHPGALLPRVLLAEPSDNFKIRVSISVEFVADFLMTNQLSMPISGSPYSGFRTAEISNVNGCSVQIVEKRGKRTFDPKNEKTDFVDKYFYYMQKWQTRSRGNDDEDFAIKQAVNLAEELAKNMGPNLAAFIVLEAERKYWQARNTAGWVQKSRQDQLGLGWANHDHHTYRSSRKHYPNLAKIFETLGFHCREKFYAGKEAGWGAQVMENSETGHTLFLDVDLAPGEIDFDIAHTELPELDKLGTVGLWCALFGDSILGAGLHHLAGHFSFDNNIKDLESFGVRTMAPFSNLAYLRQAFTEGEIWPVKKERINALLQQKLINTDEAEMFGQQGALGSHLEVLERAEGFKGFNQQNVSDIIKRTDPRF
jgi:hypothetical protein